MANINWNNTTSSRKANPISPTLAATGDAPVVKSYANEIADVRSAIATKTAERAGYLNEYNRLNTAVKDWETYANTCWGKYLSKKKEQECYDVKYAKAVEYSIQRDEFKEKAFVALGEIQTLNADLLVLLDLQRAQDVLARTYAEKGLVSTTVEQEKSVPSTANPTLNQNAVESPTTAQRNLKRIIWITVILLVAAGGVYYYFKIRKTA